MPGDLREAMKQLKAAARQHHRAEVLQADQPSAMLAAEQALSRAAFALVAVASARASSPAPGSDTRNLPDGTLVTCEHCPTPHPKGDDGRACRFPKVASPAPAPRPEETREPEEPSHG